MSIIAIACVDANWGIGYQGKLLEHIPADMKFFKETTINNIVIMGKKTYDSIGHPLENRENIVITHSDKVLKWGGPTRLALLSLEEVFDGLIKWPQLSKKEDIYIIGGASVYKQLLPYCDKAYITHVYKSHENVDSYFPNLDQMENEWELTEESAPISYKDFYYSFKTYNRLIDYK